MKNAKKVYFLSFVTGLLLSGNCFSYTSSADAHKACDPKGVQYDSKNKQFCCGTKGGCPNPLKPVSKDHSQDNHINNPHVVSPK